jgi:hypothetical protein
MAEDVRRRLLRRTDNILDGIEALRLRDARHVPERLRTEVGDVASALGQVPPRSSVSLAATHNYVFRLQDLLLRSGSRRQPAGFSSSRALRADLPELALPARTGPGDEVWREGVRLTVQRARDLARFLASQAEAARQPPGGEASELAAARAGQAQRAARQYGRLATRAARALGHPPVPHEYVAVPTAGRQELHDLAIDQGYVSVLQGNRAVRLTALEHQVLSALAANQGKVVTREGLMHMVYGDDPELNVRSNVIDVHLSRLRSKLDNPPYLETVLGIGWKAAWATRALRPPLTTTATCGPTPTRGPGRRSTRRSTRCALLHQSRPVRPVGAKSTSQ